MKKLISALLCAAMMLTFVTVAYADFRFSPERETVKPTVETDENGVEYIGTVYGDDTTRLTVDALVLSDIQGTSSYDREKLEPADREILEAADEKMQVAHEQLTEAKSLFDLFGTEVLSPDTTYAVTSLFDLTPVGDGVATVERCFEEYGYLEVTLEIDVPTDRDYYFATLCEDEWVVLEKEQTTDNGDGTVSLRFYELCPIALIEVADDAGEVVPSPETSAGFPTLELLAIVFGVSAVVCFASLGKKRTNA